MNTDDIVCACNKVNVENVTAYLNDNPYPITSEEVQNLCTSLEIGTRCKRCLRTPCDIIDISITDVLEEYLVL